MQTVSVWLKIKTLTVKQASKQVAFNTIWQAHTVTLTNRVRNYIHTQIYKGDNVIYTYIKDDNVKSSDRL